MSKLTIPFYNSCKNDCYDHAIHLVDDLTGNPNYSTMVYPNYGSNQRLLIGVSLILVKILELTNSGTITMVGMLLFEWADKRLAWDTNLYGNITIIDVPSNTVWTPSIELINGVADDLTVPYGNRSATFIDHTGIAALAISRQYRASCAIKIMRFPFDTQNCTFTFGNTDTGVTQSEMIMFVPETSTVSLAMYTVGGEFSYADSYISSGLIKLDSTPQPAFRISLVYKRNPGFYIFNLCVPSVLLICISSLVYLIPSNNPVKITMACSLMVALYVLQQAIARLLPTTPDTPLLAIGVMIELGLGCFSVVCAVLTYTLRLVQPPLSPCIVKLIAAYDRWRCCSVPQCRNAPADTTAGVVLANTNRLGSFELSTKSAANDDNSSDAASTTQFAKLMNAIVELTDKYCQQLGNIDKMRSAQSETHLWNVFDRMLNVLLFLVYYGVAIASCVLFLFTDAVNL